MDPGHKARDDNVTPAAPRRAWPAGRATTVMAECQGAPLQGLAIQNVQSLDGVLRQHRVVRHAGDRRGHRAHIVEELHDLHRVRVGHVDHVLVPHRELLGKEEARRIAEIRPVDGRDELLVLGELREVHAHRRKRLAILHAVEEDLARIGAAVEKAAGLRHGFVHGQLFLLERILSRHAAGLTGGAERANGDELLLLAVDVDHVARGDEDVLARIVDEAREVDGRPFLAALQGHKQLVAGELGAPGLRDHVEDAIAARPDAELVGPVDDVADDGDLRRVLLDERDQGLRLDRAVLELGLDLALNVGDRSARRLDLAGKRDRDGARSIDRLPGQRDEVSRPDAGFRRDEEPAGRGLEDRDLHDVADADADDGSGTFVAAERAEEGVGSDVDGELQHVAIDVEQNVVEDYTLVGRDRGSCADGYGSVIRTRNRQLSAGSQTNGPHRTQNFTPPRHPDANTTQNADPSYTLG